MTTKEKITIGAGDVARVSAADLLGPVAGAPKVAGAPTVADEVVAVPPTQPKDEVRPPKYVLLLAAHKGLRDGQIVQATADLIKELDAARVEWCEPTEFQRGLQGIVD